MGHRSVATLTGSPQVLRRLVARVGTASAIPTQAGSLELLHGSRDDRRPAPPTPSGPRPREPDTARPSRSQAPHRRRAYERRGGHRALPMGGREHAASSGTDEPAP